MKRNVSAILVAVLIASVFVGGCSTGSPSTPSAPAVDFPTKPINFLVAFAAGGNSDVGARIVTTIAEKKLGQSIVVANKGGAGGQTVWTELAQAKADGYTLGMINLPALNISIADPERKATYNIDSFTYIINQVLDPGSIWVKASSPYKTLKDLIDAAKAKPGTITVGANNILSDDHLAILMLESVTGIKFRAVHQDGSAEQMTAILGDHVEAASGNVGGVAARVKSGELRVLAVFDKERSKMLPDVPTMTELGYPTGLSRSTRGIVGPKGIPDPIVKKLQTVLKEAMDTPEHAQKLEQAGLVTKVMVGDEYAAYVREQQDNAKKLVDLGRAAR